MIATLFAAGAATSADRATTAGDAEVGFRIVGRGLEMVEAVPGGEAGFRAESRIRNGTGGCSVTALQLVYPGWWVLGWAKAGGRVGEQPIEAPLSVEAAIETVTPPASHQVTFSSKTIGMVPPGANLRSDPLEIALPPGAEYYVRTDVVVPPGASLPRVYQPTLPGEGGVRGSAPSGQIAGTGTLARREGAPMGRNYGPVAILGRSTGGCRGLVILGDSIAFGRNDSAKCDGNGNCGIVARGLCTVGGAVCGTAGGLGGTAGRTLPYLKLARSGDRCSTVIAGGAARQALFRYGDIMIIECGSNDIAGGAPLERIKGDLAQIWGIARASGVKTIYQVLILPRGGSQDGFASAEGQRPARGFEPGGVRDQLNQWIIATAGAAGSPLSGYIDPNPGVEDPAHHGRWIANGTPRYCTADGTHPSPACYQRASITVKETIDRLLH
jgi:lysophospholipase L1-like esterase